MVSVGLVLYPRFTALDIVGPFQTLVDVPGLDVFFVAEKAGLVSDHTGRLNLVATKSFAEIDQLDVVVVPGGMADGGLVASDPVVEFVKRIHPMTTWTTSVCTGSIYLATAGILEGVEATTHWASYERLRVLGAIPVETRVVRRGKVITAAGVSSGIDMGLTLVAAMFGDEMAQAIQLAIEYDPQPPFDSGAPSKVAPDILAMVQQLFSQ